MARPHWRQIVAVGVTSCTVGNFSFRQR